MNTVTPMDYIYEAFGRFEPHLDRDAAAKFSLRAILEEARLDDLERLLTANDRISGVGGEPGWQLDRSDAAEPSAMSFHARVDPESFALGHPEASYSAARFWAILQPMLNAFVAHQPQSALTVERIARQAPVK